jgi:hypothetical protein
MSARTLFALVTLVMFAGCGKIPESETAKKVGNIPKQTIDNTRSDVEKALQQGVDRNQEAEKKEEQKQ